LKIKEQET